MMEPTGRSVFLILCIQAFVKFLWLFHQLHSFLSLLPRFKATLGLLDLKASLLSPVCSSLNENCSTASVSTISAVASEEVNGSCSLVRSVRPTLDICQASGFWEVVSGKGEGYQGFMIFLQRPLSPPYLPHKRMLFLASHSACSFSHESTQQRCWQRAWEWVQTALCVQLLEILSCCSNPTFGH